MDSPKNVVDKNHEFVDVESIMREIRLDLLNKQDVIQQIPELTTAISGTAFQPDLYDHLYQAAIAASVENIELLITTTNFPVFGPVWDRLRRKLHKLIFYNVITQATSQTTFNQQVLKAVAIMVKKLESNRYSYDDSHGLDNA